MKFYFRWKLILGFFGFAVAEATLLVAWLFVEASQGHVFAGDLAVTNELRQWLHHILAWALLVLALVSIAPALWIASRLNRLIRLLDDAMQKVSKGDLDATVPPLRTYDEFEGLIENFNLMLTGLRQLKPLQAERGAGWLLQGSESSLQQGVGLQ